MLYPVASRSFQPLGAAQPIARSAPYGSYSYREQRNPMFGYDPSSQLMSHIRRSAEGAAGWLLASERANASAKSMLNPVSSALQERSVSSAKPEAVTGQAARGAKTQSFAVQVDAVAAAQQNRGFELAKHGSAVAEAGAHTFDLTIGGQSRAISVTIGETDTNGDALVKLRDAINRSQSGVTAAIKEDKEAGTVRLELQSRETGTKQAFSLTDRDGSAAVSAFGIDTEAAAAADAVYRVNGGGKLVSQSNNVSVGKDVQLQLKAATDSAVQVKVGLDADAVVKQVKEAVGEVNKLAGAFAEHSAYLNPAMRRSLDQAMTSGAAERLGISRHGDGYKLDETKLRAAIESRPEIARHDLGGSGGWASSLARTLDRYESLPAQALLSPAAQRMTAYASYPTGIQTYWQVPQNGWLLNSMF